MKDREKLQSNPALWLIDEVKELKAEEPFSDKWQSEMLDVLGLLSLHKKKEGWLLVLTTILLPIGYYNNPILEPAYNSWTQKNTVKGRSPIPVSDLTEVKSDLLRVKKELDNMGADQQRNALEGISNILQNLKIGTLEQVKQMTF